MLEYLDLLIPMYNLKEFSSNYSETTGSSWCYSKNEATNINANIANTNNFKCFEYKAISLGNTEAQSNLNEANEAIENVTVAVSLKYLRKFWISLKMPLVNCKVEVKIE